MGVFANIDEAVGVVTNSMEFQRIMALPRRVLDLDAVQDVTPLVAKPGGSMSVWPIQSAALIEAAIANGLFGSIGVGYGKTLITLLMPLALDSKKTVLLVPPRLKRKTLREIDEIYSKHFDLPLDRLVIVSYHDLSSVKHADVLEKEKPDLIVADEGHSLARKQSVRTGRFLDYMRDNPHCRFVLLSGTVSRRGVADYAHLIELALRKNSPLPRGYREVKDWGGALDVKPEYEMHPGVLQQFCGPGESVRDGFRRRLVETPGVVATSDNDLGASLNVCKVKPAVPDRIKQLIKETKRTWSIGGDDFDSAVTMSRVLKQLSCGFYYRWDWPGGVPDEEWIDARSNWNRAVREVLKRSKKGMDSPLLVYRAAKAGRINLPEWGPWERVRNRPIPPTTTMWLDEYLVDAALKWADKQKKYKRPAIIWYEHKALGLRIAERSSFPHFGAGTDADESTHPVIVCSIKAQGEGKNLQHYCSNLMTTLPVSGKTFEQAAGRTHRNGQRADEVTVDWFAPTWELERAMQSLLEDAEYLQDTLGQRQKILYATRI